MTGTCFLDALEKSDNCEAIIYCLKAVVYFSDIKNKSKIIDEVKKFHSDKCPIIAFFKIDGNKEFLDWILESVK